MTNLKQYFRSHLKGSIKTFIYITLAITILTFLFAINGQPTFYYEGKEKIITYNTLLFVPVVLMCIVIYILPVLEFSFFKKRINLDCVYALPISRRAMGAVHYLTGLIMLWCAFTASYLTNFILLLSRGPGYFEFSPMIDHYFLCLALGFAIYSFLVFVFNEANTKGDGIWFMFLYTFVLILPMNSIINLIGANNHDDLQYTIPWMVFDKLNTEYQNLVSIRSEDKMLFSESSVCIFWYVFWMVVGIASAIGFFITFGKRRMEKTEEISSSYFGFRLLIPVYAISAMIALKTVSSTIIWFVIVEVLTFIGYTIYRRGFHFKKIDIAVLCALAIFMLI